MAKPTLELSSEENGPEINRPLSEMMSDTNDLSKTQHQRDLSNEIGSGLISASGSLKMPKKSIGVNEMEVKSPLEFEGQSKARLGTGEKL